MVYVYNSLKLFCDCELRYATFCGTSFARKEYYLLRKGQGLGTNFPMMPVNTVSSLESVKRTNEKKK